jgi:S1-C subfamily serine protease
MKYLYKLLFFGAIFSGLGCLPYISTETIDQNIISNASYTDEESEDYKYDATDYSNKNIDSVVELSYILILPNGVEHYSSATGFSIKYDKKRDISYILTNEHFCSGGPASVPGIFTYTSNVPVIDPGQIPVNPIFVIHSDPIKDLCLMATSGKIKPVKLESKHHKMKNVEDVTIIGAPNGIFPIVIDAKITGRVSRIVLDQTESDGDNLLLISGVVHHGESGSPIFDDRGRVMGVVFICFSNRNGPTYGGLGIPLKDIYDFLDAANFKL